MGACLPAGKQKDGQIDRQSDRQTDTDTDRQTDRQAGRQMRRCQAGVRKRDCIVLSSKVCDREIGEHKRVGYG